MKRAVLFIMVAIMAITMLGCSKEEKLSKEGPIGTTLKSDLVEVTLTEFGFAEEGVSIDEEKPEILCKPVPFPYELTGNEAMDNLTLQLSQSKYVRATDKKCVAYMEYTVKIISEEMVKQGMVPTICFNGADEYKLNGISGTVLSDYFNGEYDGVNYVQLGDNWETHMMFWSAGEEYTCRAVAKIPVEVETSADASLTVTFMLPNADGASESYTYIIR